MSANLFRIKETQPSLRLQTVEIEETKRLVSLRKDFTVPYGFCFRAEGLAQKNFSYKDLAVFEFNEGQFDFIITDSNMRTDYYIAEGSFILGDRLPVIQANQFFLYEISIKKTIKDQNDPRTSCRVYSTSGFIQCVQEAERQELMQTIGCLPPFMNANASITCSPASNLDPSKRFKYFKFFTRITLNIFYRQFYPLAQCPLPCTTLEITAKLIQNTPKLSKSRIDLIYKALVEVVVTKQSYTFTTLLVEIWSVLGFWIGVSVFSLYDGGMLMFFKFLPIFKKGGL